MSKRNPNFTAAETESLISLVTENIDIIDSRKSDSISQRKKEDCWKAIEEIFNINSLVYRNYKELRKKYENLKAQSKRTSCSEEPQNPFSFIGDGNTGGLAKKPKLNDDDLMKIRSLSPKEIQEFVKECNSDRDGNNIHNDPLDGHENHYTSVVDLFSNDSNEDFQDITADAWDKNSVKNSNTSKGQNVKSLPSSYLKFPPQRPTKCLKDEKLMLETVVMRDQHREFLETKKLEREIMLEKHEMDKERHKIEMELLRVELEKKKKELL